METIRPDDVGNFDADMCGEVHQAIAVNERMGIIPSILLPISKAMPLTSFDLSNLNGRIDAYNAAQSEDLALAECLDAEIEVSNYIVYAGTMSDPESGVSKEIVRVALVGPDGTVYGGASEGIINSVRSLVTIFGVGPWKPPVHVVVKERKSKNGGRRFHVLQIVRPG